MKEKYIDLHVHTNNSDGAYSPKQIVNMSKENEVKILSIADHDSITGLNEFKESIEFGMLGVNGVEFSSFVNNDNERLKIHILGYGFDENNLLFQSLINEMKDKRIESHLKLLKEVREKIKKLPEEELSKLDFNRYCWFDREVIKCCEKAGYSNDLLDYLKIYYKENRFSYGADYDLDAQRVIEAIHSAGGYAIFAHPMAYRFSANLETVKDIISKLLVMGIDGLEIFQSDCDLNKTIWLKRIVDKTGILYSVGSDFHRCINSDGRQIGTGINNNLCITETSLTDEIVRKKKYFKKVD